MFFSYLFKFLLGGYLKKKNKTVKDCGKIICLYFFFSAKNNFLAFFLISPKHVINLTPNNVH